MAKSRTEKLREGAGDVVGIGSGFRFYDRGHASFFFVSTPCEIGEVNGRAEALLVCGGFERCFMAIELSASSLHFACSLASVVGLSVRLLEDSKGFICVVNTHSTAGLSGAVSELHRDHRETQSSQRCRVR
jgi:hypothetical protein